MSEISPLFAIEAEKLLNEGKPEQAAELCERGLDEYPDYTAALIVLAKAYQAIGKADVAEETKKSADETQLPTARNITNIHSVIMQTASELPTEPRVDDYSSEASTLNNDELSFLGLSGKDDENTETVENTPVQEEITPDDDMEFDFDELLSSVDEGSVEEVGNDNLPDIDSNESDNEAVSENILSVDDLFEGLEHASEDGKNTEPVKPAILLADEDEQGYAGEENNPDDDSDFLDTVDVMSVTEQEPIDATLDWVSDAGTDEQDLQSLVEHDETESEIETTAQTEVSYEETHVDDDFLDMFVSVDEEYSPDEAEVIEETEETPGDYEAIAEDDSVYEREATEPEDDAEANSDIEIDDLLLDYTTESIESNQKNEIPSDVYDDAGNIDDLLNKFGATEEDDTEQESESLANTDLRSVSKEDLEALPQDFDTESVANNTDLGAEDDNEPEEWDSSLYDNISIENFDENLDKHITSDFLDHEIIQNSIGSSDIAELDPAIEVPEDELINFDDETAQSTLEEDIEEDIIDDISGTEIETGESDISNNTDILTEIFNEETIEENISLENKEFNQTENQSLINETEIENDPFKIDSELAEYHDRLIHHAITITTDPHEGRRNISIHHINDDEPGNNQEKIAFQYLTPEGENLMLSELKSLHKPVKHTMESERKLAIELGLDLDTGLTLLPLKKLRRKTHLPPNYSTHLAIEQMSAELDSYLSGTDEDTADSVEKPVIITETIANILASQGRVIEAIEAFRHLALENPDRKDYFIQKANELVSSSF